MDAKSHWSDVYQQKAITDVSWYQPYPKVSLDLIAETGLGPEASLIDVGSGASLLADALLDRGYSHLSLLDVSAEALDAVRARLGDRARHVVFIEDDVLKASLPGASFDLWHDRAVFHFLTEPELKRAYVDQVYRCVRPGGHVIVATFALDGPERCSGLPVARYDANGLHGAFGPAFSLRHSLSETHVTPWGAQQQFTYCYCRLGA
jgi:SAM-dependent methyltransferase